MNVIDNLRVLAEEATHKAIHHFGFADGVKAAVEIVLQNGTAVRNEPEPQLALPSPAPQPPRPVAAASATKKAKSAEIMAPVFDLLRERGTWMTVAEVIAELDQIGVTASEVVAIRALMGGVRSGHLERNGDTYRAGKLKR